MNRCRFLLGLSALLVSLVVSHAAPASLRMLTQNRYSPGIPVLVRVEGYGTDGARDRETWDTEAILSVDGLGVTLSTNRIIMRNGMGSALVTFTGGSSFNLYATVGSVSVSRPMQSLQGSGVTRVGGTLSGGSSTWSGTIHVTNDLIITNHTLTIQSNTLVLLHGTNGAGSGGADIIVNANASIQSLGTELHPVTITCSNTSMAFRWGQIRHNSSLPSLYRHTFIHRGGRAPGEGHTGQAPVVRPDGTTLTFESCSITDLAENAPGTGSHGTPGKVMYARNSALTFNDCLLSRARMGPEIEGTSLLFTNSYILETRGNDDSDGIYLHGQQAGQQLKLVDAVIGFGDDDGIDTLSSDVTVENCIIRDWPNPNEDAKGISQFNRTVDVKHCLIVDCWVGVSAKWNSGGAAIMHVNNSTIQGISNSIGATFKANAPGPFVDFRITNSIVTGVDPFKTDFGPTNFTVRYTCATESMPGTGNVTADPLYMDEPGNNFRLKLGSPAINAGNPASPLDTDGTVVDMGYFPFLTNPDPLIALGSSWRYHDKGADLGTIWSARLFDDSSWSNGVAELGYGDLDEVTRVEDNPTPGYVQSDTDRYITTYFRRAFTVLNPSELTNVEAQLVYDDGAVVYLNGQELFRTNMPAGVFDYLSLAPNPIEESVAVYTFSPSLLLAGTNVIAVEMHQQSSGSTDISFDFALIGYRGLASGVPSVAIVAPANNASFQTPANIPVTVDASDPGGTITSVQLFQNSQLLFSTNGAPLTFNWQNVPVGSYALTAVATDNSGNSRTSTTVNITVSAPSTITTNTLITLGSNWRYLDNGTDQGTNWSQLGFNDSGWSNGPAPLGYCTSGCTYGIVTTVSFGGNAGNKYVTTYFRRTFNIANASRVQGMRLGLLRDDGVVIHINGREVWRTNMPLTTINYLTPASGASNYPFEQNMLPTNALAALVNGTNVIAVEVHQGNAGSSDLALDLQLDGVIAAATNETPIVNITAPADGSTFPAPLSTAITANAVDVDGTVTNVAFFVNGVKLVDDTTSPYSAPWNSVPAGTYSLMAVATDNVGLVATSSVVNVTVSTNTAAPIVFAKNPAPGSLTSLTQITVTFSKAVQGVSASDLLINGSAATNVSGSGSNYTFTFPQPAYGNVSITWAGAHGITDTFTPPVAFNTNSAGANWSYTLLDVIPPTITTIDPTPNSTIAALTSISVTFSEPVTGVNASDLLINSLAASGLSGSGAGPYTFTFAQPPQGVVQVGWVGGHGIQDTSANPFSPAPWSYTLDTNSSGVLISEIMYHPSTENVLEEYIELYNKGASSVDLTGWQFTGGVQFTFPAISIPAGGYLVIAADLPTFEAKYPLVANAIGGWTGVLNNDSEDIDLDDANGNRVDSVTYADEGEWAVRQRGNNDGGFRGWTWSKPHDGNGSSLELINPNLSNNEGQNWAGSTTLDGTPGQINSVYQNNIAPLILGATHFPIIPRSTDQAIISARILDEAAGGLSVNLFYRVSSASPPAFTQLAMSDDGLTGDAVANDGLFTARLPLLAHGNIVEFYISAADNQARTRTWPAPAIASADNSSGPTGQVANALFQIDNEIYTNGAPLYKMVLTVNEQTELGNVLNGAPNSDASMNMTWITIDGVETLLRYQCTVRNRGHGSRNGNPHNYRAGFNSDNPWKDLAALNLNARVTYAQHFGSVIARRSGAEGGNSRAVRLRINGGVGPGGTPTFDHYAANEDLGSDWARNHFPDDDNGNIYKAIRDIAPPNFDYRGTAPASYMNTYFKQSNVSENDWTDLIAMLEVMGENRTNLFTSVRARNVINVEQWMRHLAVMNLFGNNETGLNTGYNDDYYTYRGVNDPRFILLYHDLDQILGQGGSLPTNSPIFTATQTPGAGTGTAMNWFMHQPEFEALYYRTLQDLLDTTFSQSQFNALIDSTLSSYVPTGTIDSMKNWMNARRAFVQGVITGLVPPATNNPIATISGEPRSPSPLRNATLSVGGESIVSYSFRLNNGAWSAETPVATPISLSNLPQGSTNTVYVVGKNSGGIFQNTNAPTISETWVVNTNTPRVRLNEVLASNNGSLIHVGTTPDAIELFNDGTGTVNLNGLRLTDDKDEPNKFTFGNINLNSGAYLIVYANDDDGTGGIHTGFSLDASGDQVYLFDRATNGNVILDSVKFGMQITDLSIGRVGAGGDWALTTPTFGTLNATQALGNQLNLRINEWLAASGLGEDFIELYNPNGLPVALGGLYLTDTPIGAPALNRIDDLSFIGANSFLSFVADGDGDPANHVNFQLPSEQGEIALFSATLQTIDCIAYGPQTTDVSQGKCPNGGATYATLGTPTPGAPNSCPFVPPPPVTVTLLTISNSWRYQPRTNYDAVNWTANNHNDSSWPVGLALLGRQSFASNQVWPEPFRTHIETNVTQTNFYFRAHFNVAPGVTFNSLSFRHIIDDGAVFFLNGVEIPGSRFNMPGGTVTAATPASSTISVGAYQGPITIPVSMLVTGDNVFAVSLHQSLTGGANVSSDLAMGVELSGFIVTNSPAAAGVLINEVLANNMSMTEPDGSTPDWVELYNPSTNAVDLGDMSLTDDTTVSRRWVFPSGSILSGLSFMKVRFDSTLPSSSTNAGFGLRANGGSVYLFNRIADGASLLSSITYGLQAADFSIGRVPDGSTNWVLNTPSLGGGNLAAALGNVSLIRVNEWLANPVPGEDDYFEIFNPNSQPVDISRFYLTDDLLAAPTKHQLPALSFIGIGQNSFQLFIADGITVNGADHVNFSLRAQGEAVGISPVTGTFIDSISFGNQSSGVSQGRLPDGAATIVNFSTTKTPGKSNFLPLNSIVVNELLAHSDLPLEDAVEFYNPTPDDVDISGWYLSDSQNDLLKYRIPSNTVVSAGGYKVLYEFQFNGEGSLPFSFSSAKGDEVYLSQSTNAGTLTGYRAFATFGASENGVSFGRFRTSVGDDFTAMSARSLGQDSPANVAQFRTGTGLTNPYPKVGPVVINEMMYNQLGTNDALEFVELRNITASAVRLYDTNNPGNTWRLRKGIDFNFPTNITIPANGYLVVVSFDPAIDLAAKANFTNAYGAASAGALVGPYSGKMDNAGEAVELQKPDAPQTIPGPDFGLVPYIVVDRVVYDDVAPWPTSPDGFGDALKKTVAGLYGNEPLNWQGGPPTPGAANGAGTTNTPPVLNAIADRSVHKGHPLSFTVSATDADLPAQTLLYSLDAPVPAGASVGSGSGVFSWTPGTNQGPANYTVTVRVTDNGAPALSDTKSFQIAVLNLPQVHSVELTNGNVVVRWDSFVGRRYRVESTLNLTTPNWTQVGSDVIATGTASTLIIPGGSDPQRFYRILSFNN